MKKILAKANIIINRHIIKCSSIAIILLFLNSCNTHAVERNRVEGKWYIELEHNDIGRVRTLMDIETDGETFIAYTRKNADKDILGSWTSILGRTFTKSFKDGCLLRIEKGIFAIRNDTLKLAGIFTSAMGNENMQGYIINDTLYAKIGRPNNGYRGTIKGYRKLLQLPMEDYSAIFKKSVKMTGDRIFRKDILQTTEWKNFTKSMSEVSPKMQDDLEMVFAFFYYARKLPFSHYALMKMPRSKMDNQKIYEQCFFLEEKTPSLAYLKVTSLSGTAAEVDSVFSIIRDKKYSNLIIDMRNNMGGNVEAGMELATNVADTTFYGGIFLTQKYFNENRAVPVVSEYNNFPHFTEANFDLIIEGIHKAKGLCLKIIPKAATYKGNIYILTNGRTASTCEPIVYGLKQNGRAIVVGEKTAGAMLNGEVFDLDAGFNIVIPTADYYTSDGNRIDKKGVDPNINVKEEEALEYVINNLIK